ncbi:hypothetical protein [Rhodococcus opacus]|nr:hypothetical protein [Rhodococcus opacus]MBV6758419.1 hypothetical protein [Rhodococcus opacus]
MKRHEDDVEPVDIHPALVFLYLAVFLALCIVGLWAAHIFLMAVEVAQ